MKVKSIIPTVVFLSVHWICVYIKLRQANVEKNKKKINPTFYAFMIIMQ